MYYSCLIFPCVEMYDTSAQGNLSINKVFASLYYYMCEILQDILFEELM